MWWCCGKKDKNAKGCKIGSHENFDEDNNEQDDVD
jgi:hypothetical protein